MMKRNIALLLIAALLASFLVLPVSAAEIPEIKLSVVPFTEDAENGTIIEGTAKETYEAGDAVACKVEFVNNDVVRWLNTFAIDLMYDNTKLSLYSFESADEEDVGPLVNELGGLAYPSTRIEGRFPFTLVQTSKQKVAANKTKTMAYILFKINGEAESGDLTFAVDKDSDKNQVLGSLSKTGEAEKFTEIDYSDIAVEAPVIGVAPTIDSVKVDPDSAEYASGDVLTLSATSKAGSNITSLVTFEVTNDAGSPATGFTLDAENATLTVNETDPASVGTYTVKASAKGEESRGEATATFTINPKKVTNPTLTVVGFGKGQAKGSLTFKDVTGGLAVPTGYNCYEGQEAIGIPNNERTFEAGTTYTIAITLNPAENYAFDEKNLGSVTITINGEEKIVEIVKKTDFETPYYQAVVTATTADKDVPTLTLTPIEATYGDKLSDLELKGTANSGGNEVKGTFEWVDSPDTTVGNAGEQKIKVKFTPENTDIYDIAYGEVTVTVAKQKITFNRDDYKWRPSNDETPTEVKDDGEIVFTYDGKEHGIEAYCENSAIADDVEIVYDSGERSFVSSKGSTVTAHVEVKDKKNYELDGGPNIQSGFIRILPIVVNYDGEYAHSVEVCYTTSSVDIPLSAFGLPDEVLNDTNNKYWMRTDAVVAGDVNVISGTPTSFDEANRTLTLNLKSSLTKDDARKTATVTLGLKVNNYETTNPGVAGIANKEEKLFILKLNVKIIEKENAGLTITGIPETLVYGESAEWSYNVTNPGENGQISGSVTPAGILNNDPYKLTAIGVGEATVTITYSSDTTYAQEKFTITVTPKPLTAAVSHAPITYGDPAPTEGYTVEFNGLLTGDVLADTDYTVGTAYKQGDPVGKYAFTCVLNSETVKNYKLDTVNGELVVNKKELTDGDVTVTVLGETPVYDGSEKKPAVEVKYGETTLAAADYTVSYSNNIKAGTATVTVTSTDDSSYKFTATKNFTIAQAPISGAVIDDIADVTYDTKAHTPEVTVMFNGTTLKAGEDYEVAYDKNINAGTAAVTVTAKENGNFTGTKTTTFTISKANLTLSPYTISKLCTETEATTETLPSKFFLAGETETGFSIALSVRNVLDIFAKEPEVVSGENKITYQLNGKVGEAAYFVTVTPVSHNYNVGEYDLKIETYDRTNISGSISFPDGSAVYTGTGIKYENATISGYSGTLRYGYTPNASTGASLDASGLPLTVGTYTVAVTFNSDASFGYKTATFTITKATPTGTPGYTKLETSGKTLADAKLTVGTIRPAGTIAWDLPLTTVLEDGKAYAWTFTPNDTHNYTILTGTLVPYVDDGMDYIPGVIGGNTGSFNFHDVSRLDYFYDAVKWAAENGIASGTGRYTFSPNAVCTRAQTVTFLWRAAGSPLPRYRVCPFTDVQPSDYYYNAVLWAVEQGITTGLNATTFGPDVTVTRGQVATFLYRAASAAKPNTFNPFTDVKTTAYNYDAILWAYDNRITTGTSDTTFSPDAYCTRAQIVTFLYRYYQGR